MNPAFELFLQEHTPLQCLWLKLSALVENVSLPLPFISFGEYEEGYYNITWNHKSHFLLLEIDLHPDQSIHWFFKNTITEECAGSEIPTMDCSVLQPYLQKLCISHVFQ